MSNAENIAKYKRMNIFPVEGAKKTGYKILVDETRMPSNAHILCGVVLHGEIIPWATALHGASTVMALQDLFEYLGLEIEIHYTTAGFVEMFDLADELGIKVITRSVAQFFYSDQDIERLKRFSESGGILFNAAGNDLNGKNEPTSFPNDYGISVGCLNAADNSGSTAVGLSGWELPKIEGMNGSFSDHYYTDTSGATPILAGCGLVNVVNRGFNLKQQKEAIARTALRDAAGLEEGEVFFQMEKFNASPVELCRFKIGSTKAIVKGKEITLDQAPEVDEDTDRTLMPVRAVLEALGYTVIWNQETQEIAVY